MSILRKQQIDEILNADNKINRQIIERQNTQVKQFNEERKEKNTIQIANDVNIDGNVDKLLQILESKYNSGENFLMSSFSYDSSNQKLLTQVLSNQEIITLFNKTVNLLNSSIMEDTSKEALKLKILQLKPLIDSISFILFSIIRVFDDIESHPRYVTGGGYAFINPQGLRIFFNKFLPRIFTAYATIRVIQKQLERNTYKPITIDEINTEFNQFIDDYRSKYGNNFIDDPDTQSVLNESIKNKAIKDASEKRIKQMEQELGGKPLAPEEIKMIRNMYLTTPRITSNLSEEELKAIAESIYGIGEQMRKKREDRIMAGLPPEEIPDEIPLQEQEITGKTTENTQITPEDANSEMKRATQRITTNFNNDFSGINFPNVGQFSLATARTIEPALLKTTQDITKYLLSSINKGEVDDSVVEDENALKLQTYNNIWSRIINKTNNTPLTGAERQNLKSELAKIKRDYKKMVQDANKINEDNYIDFIKSRNTQRDDSFIFTGQGQPFLYNDENN